MADWFLSKSTGTGEDWPGGPDGKRVKPVLLEHLSGVASEFESDVSLLRAYGIPVFYTYPMGGEFGQLLFGQSGTGVDLYVPETQLEDAQNLLSADVDLSEFDPEGTGDTSPDV